MSKARIEAFSDGVIAVAITLLALDLKVPEPTKTHSLAHSLGVQWPTYAAYVISFVTIGIIWINHHAMFRRLKSVDHAILMINIVLLLAIAVLPFSTALMADYLTASRGQHLAAVVYGASLLAMALTFLALQRHVLLAKTELLHESVTAPIRRAILRRNAAGVLPYVLATVGAIITPYLTLGICAVIAIFYALPGTTSDA
jgi:uncharacterized membrane protein